MKKRTFIVIISLLLCLCYSCRMPQYIPIETIKTEYRNNTVRDSIYQLDSIYIKEKGDTLIMERYRYFYKDKFIRDSIFINDTIKVPYPVEVVKSGKKRLTGWQNFQVWCGRLALATIMFIIIYFVFKRRI